MNYLWSWMVLMSVTETRKSKNEFKTKKWSQDWSQVLHHDQILSATNILRCKFRTTVEKHLTNYIKYLLYGILIAVPILTSTSPCNILFLFYFCSFLSSGMAFKLMLLVNHSLSFLYGNAKT